MQRFVFVYLFFFSVMYVARSLHPSNASGRTTSEGRALETTTFGQLSGSDANRLNVVILLMVKGNPAIGNHLGCIKPL